MNTNYNNNVAGALKLININNQTYQLGKDATVSEGGISKLFGGSGAFETYKASTDGSYDAKTVYDEISAINSAISGNGADSVASQISDINTAIGTINDTIGTVESGHTVEGDIALAEAAAKSYADGLDTAMDARMDTVEAAIQTLNGNSSTSGSVAYAVKEAIDDVVDGAPDTFDTLKEIADWITADQTGAAAILADVANKKDKQDAVNDPTVGSATDTLNFIATISQDENGEITATKQSVRSASASQSGLMSAAHYSKLDAISATVANDTLTIVTVAPAA